MKVLSYLESFTRKAYAAHEPAGEQFELLDCSLGVNSFGVSEKVLQALKEYDWSRVWSCPDPSYKDLKAKIIEFWSDHADLKTSQIQIGHGSMEVLERLNRMFLDKNSKVLGYAPQFTGYVADIGACGAQYIPVVLRPEENFKLFVERLTEKINSEYSLIFIDNPNNPTGQMISLSDIEALLKEARDKDVAVIVDEAYGDYFEAKDSAVNLVGKGLGLCSLKIGYGILSQELSYYFNKVTPPFRATTISSYLAGIALSDQDFIAGCRKRVKIEKAKLINGLRERGYFIADTYEYCPILLLVHNNKDIDLGQALLSRGIVTVSGPDFESLDKNSVRINCPASAEDLLSRLD
ncbi:MAG: histidinol-phosphate aminotransferase family protein [Deltaproteobacteria bacterium]|nr:histidinol-phosphate aminotransferase family protein [Deltaproteobacteria bacterium]